MALTTLAVTLASKATPRNGFGGASTVWPALSSSRITPANPDASAKAPWTRTTVGPGMGFSSRLERWPQRRYVTGPERAGPRVRRPGRGDSNRHGRARGTVAAAARHAADAADLGQRRRASAPLRTGLGRPGAGSATVRGGPGVTGLRGSAAGELVVYGSAYSIWSVGGRAQRHFRRSPLFLANTRSPVDLRSGQGGRSSS